MPMRPRLVVIPSTLISRTMAHITLDLTLLRGPDRKCSFYLRLTRCDATDDIPVLGSITLEELHSEVALKSMP